MRREMFTEEVASSEHVVAGKPTATPRLQGDGTSAGARHSCLWAASESTPPLLEPDLSLAFLMGALEDEFNRTTAINVGEPRQVSSEQTHTATWQIDSLSLASAPVSWASWLQDPTRSQTLPIKKSCLMVLEWSSYRSQQQDRSSIHISQPYSRSVSTYVWNSISRPADPIRRYISLQGNNGGKYNKVLLSPSHFLIKSMLY